MTAKRMMVFTGENVCLHHEDPPCPATLIVDKSTGKIAQIIPGRADRDAHPQVQDADWIDAGDKFVLPGLVDAHVHLNEPGRTDWEGFWTGTRAAASGGVTTLVDMPLNSIPPTTTVENLNKKRAAATGQCWTDVAFWGGVIPGNQAHLKPLVKAGVKGFKCFLIESGVDEFPCVTEADLDSAMAELSSTSTVLCFHAELCTAESAAQTQTSEHDQRADPREYSTFLSSRPDQLEVDALGLITRLHDKHPSLRLHIVHLSSAHCLPLVRAAKARGRPLTAETCFHYLCFSARDVPRGRPEFKCCPPIRGAQNRERLWEALRDGTVDCVVSDHSPCVVELKRIGSEGEGDVMGAWGGISTLGLGLGALWTEARRRGVGIGEVVRWACVRTAEHAGLEGVKGRLAVGYDADIVLWDPDAEFEVTKESLQFKNKLSPYEGLVLQGRVEKTFLRGTLIYDRATPTGFDGLSPIGQLL